MTGAYTETTVKRKKTIGSLFAKAGLVLLTLILLILGFVGGVIFDATVSTICLILGLGMVFLMAMLFSRFNVVYEYIYCDGQIDFDKILGGEKRKRMLQVDLDNIEIWAPEGSDELKAFDNARIVNRDFTSMDPDARVFVLVAADGPNRYRVRFEPSDKMLELAKQKAARKVHLDKEGNGKPFIQ